MDIEKAIKRCEDIIKKNNKVVKEARKIGDTNTMQLIAGLDGESLAIETVLNMLKEKDKEINRKSSSIKALQCALHERTEERDRKDSIITRQNKQIDLMEEFIYLMWCDYPMKITKRLKDNGFDDKECETCKSKEKNCLDCLEKYFKSKAEKEQI